VKPQLIVLGAGPSRGAGRPLGLQKVTLKGRVLDWQLDAFSVVSPEVCFVGGYDIGQVIQVFPRLTYHYNPQWHATGAVFSLALALESIDDLASGCRDLYVAYSDILLRRELVQAMADAAADSCAVAVDEIHADAGGQTPETLTLDGNKREFVGLVRVPAALVPAFREEVLRRSPALSASHLSGLFSELAESAGGLPLTVVAAQGLWAHAEHGRSVARFVLGSKAATLARLQNRLQRSTILPLLYFTRREWETERAGVLNRLRDRFGGQRALIVRSSATDEDGFQRANAGRYLSQLDVAPEEVRLAAAIERVFASYSGADADDEVLVQPQLDAVKASGVAFTRTLESGAPYRVINYSDAGDTTAITAGASRDGVKLYVSRFAETTALVRLPAIGRRVVAAMDEIEQCVCHDALDIEFAIAADDRLYTLQVRPLMVSDVHQDRETDAEVADCLYGLAELLAGLTTPPQGQVGRDALWSVMADWNPAEIIGLTPGPLAFDLYRYIITDEVWAQQRQQVGYRDLRGWPLVRCFAGQAFVDVRASLNSFLPAALPDSLAARFVDHAQRLLRSNPALHDKIEFTLLPTCLDFGFVIWREHYLAAGVASAREIEQLQTGLREVTRCILTRAKDYFDAARRLEARCAGLENRALPFSDWLRQTLNICSRQGALAFAHLARAGFVAAALLRSAVETCLLAESRRHQLLESVPATGHLLAAAAQAVRAGTMTREAFIGRFGHLRPGTYDIATPAYRDHPEAYLDPILEIDRAPQPEEFAWTTEEERDLGRALSRLDLGLDAQGLLDFVRTAVGGREYAKFVFTRLLSRALDGLATEGRAAGIGSERLASMPLDVWLSGSVHAWGERSARAELAQRTDLRFHQHRLAGSIHLPPVLTDPGELYAFLVPHSDPSFITNRRTSAPLRVIEAGEVVHRDAVAGCIVAIVNADPGFDYLFALGISGLITAFGGPNSHMAIRASEFAIPAVIGIGEQAFAQLRSGLLVELDGQQRLWRQKDGS